MSSSTAPPWLEQFRDAVLARGQTRAYRSNTLIAQEGEPSESLYWVVSGEVAAFVQGEDGHVLELSRMGAGEYFGELLFASAIRTASVRTTMPSRLCRIGRVELERLLIERPELALEIIRMLAQRLTALTRTVRGLALSDVYSRLERFLRDQAVPDAGRLRIDGVSQQQIADRIGASKSMVNRVLKDLEAGGYIDLQRRCIYLLAPLPKRW